MSSRTRQRIGSSRGPWWRRGGAPIGAVVALSAATTGFASSVPEPSVPDSAGQESAGRPFPAGAAWWTPVPNDPRLDRHHEALRAELSDPEERRVANLRSFAVPVYVADASTPRYTIEVTLEGFEDWGDNALAYDPVPIPDGATWAPGANGKLVVIDPSTDQVFDMWRVEHGAQGWTAAWGGIYPLSGSGSSDRPAYQGPNAVPVTTPLSRGTGSGVSTLAGLIRLSEIAAGDIPHALAFSSDLACGPPNTGPFRWPATTTDGSDLTDPCLPQGTRVYLDPTVDLAGILGISRGELAVGRALQTYGAYLTESGGTRMAFMFELPTVADDDTYAAAGLTEDYFDFDRLPWDRLLVLASWNGT